MKWELSRQQILDQFRDILTEDDLSYKLERNEVLAARSSKTLY